jgi:mono/diheme cytochrome c family protein
MHRRVGSILAASCLVWGLGGSACAPRGPDPATMMRSQEVYEEHCLVCHQASGKGVPSMVPTLVESDWVAGDEERLIRAVLEGLEGPIEVKGKTFRGVMSAQPDLSDDDVAAVLTYVRQGFGNDSPVVTPERVAEVRATLPPRPNHPPSSE